MSDQYHVALALADTMLAGDAKPAGLMQSVSWALGESRDWIPALCRAIRKRTGEHLYHYSREELAALILKHRAFCNAWNDKGGPPMIRRYCLTPPIAPETPAWLAALGLPQIANSAELAQWLQVTPGELAWYADRWRNDAPAPAALQHYRYRWVEKRSGGLRLIEMPKLRLRTIQRKVLRRLLDLVPPHPAAHGFRRGHSCLTHAAQHAGKAVVIRMDLKDFFPSIPAPRIHALFTKLGYPQSVAGALARLCTHRTPGSVFNEPEVRKVLPSPSRTQFRTPHLPQGAPTSPALANLCAYRLDLRLDALAQSLGASYSRYADDLAFSGGGELAQAMARFHVRVAAIALEEGFRVNTRKTRLMRAGARQRVTGIVVNRHPNMARKDFDTLKAILTNCVRHGPASQNRERHEDYRAFLAGKLAWLKMLNPQRGLRLQSLFEQIVWPTAVENIPLSS
jgi:RNA-directed DNA polymerase